MKKKKTANEKNESGLIVPEGPFGLIVVQVVLQPTSINRKGESTIPRMPLSAVSVSYMEN